MYFENVLLMTVNMINDINYVVQVKFPRRYK